MKPQVFDEMMRQFEVYHDLRVMPDVWPLLRVDGRSFSSLTEKSFQKPFDIKFRDLMNRAAAALLVELNALYVYVESDEISVLLPKLSNLFRRGIEKLVSISASIASSEFTLGFGARVQFDSRISVCPNEQTVIDYFRWRQADSIRNALNSWAFWTLVDKGGLSRHAAAGKLKGAGVETKRGILEEYGIDYDVLPAWQRMGSGHFFRYDSKSHIKNGINYLSNRRVAVTKENLDCLPEGDSYDHFIRRRIQDEYLIGKVVPSKDPDEE